MQKVNYKCFVFSYKHIIFRYFHCLGKSDDQEDTGKIVFKKPTKRRSSEGGVLDASTSKKLKTDQSIERKPKTKGVKNNKLLSFGLDDEAVDQ